MLVASIESKVNASPVLAEIPVDIDRPRVLDEDAAMVTCTPTITMVVAFVLVEVLISFAKSWQAM